MPPAGIVKIDRAWANVHQMYKPHNLKQRKRKEQTSPNTMAAPPPGVPASHGFKNFKYKPLDLSSNKPSIRLAVLHAAGISSAIRITLATAAFADRPRYEALSYTWGRPDVLKGIELNGVRVDIRENLWDALVNLRDAREDRVLWIDAICINQADVEERNRQVELMAYIFDLAKKVIV